MSYRDDLDAALARSQSLERELAAQRAAASRDQNRISMLEGQLAYEQERVAKLRQAPMGMPMPLDSNATTVLVLGVLSVVICGLLGPFAWSMGNTELQRIDAGLANPTRRGEASAGRILGIISTVLMGLVAVAMLFLLLVSA